MKNMIVRAVRRERARGRVSWVYTVPGITWGASSQGIIVLFYQDTVIYYRILERITLSSAGTVRVSCMLICTYVVQYSYDCTY